MATHPILVRQLQAPLMSVLEETLESHRYALRLDQDNADTLFNTAQVLTSIAEEIHKNVSASDGLAVRSLEEALELLQRCLALQEFRYTESEEQAAEALQASGEAGGRSIDEAFEQPGNMNAGSEQEQEQWALIIEPVTKDTLIDTAIAQLSTLTTLCGILGSSPAASGVPSLAWVEEYSSKLLNVRLPTLIEGTRQIHEAVVAKAVFISAMLEAGFRTNKIDLPTYRRERDAAFSELVVSESSASLMANVASLFAFNSALSEAEISSTAIADLASLRWKALATAIVNLATVSKLSDKPSEDLPKTHMLRGDGSLYQYQLSKPPLSYAPAVKNSSALLKNAEVFYRNASRLTNDDEERDRCKVREAIVVSLEGNMQAGRVQLESVTASRGDQWLRDLLEDLAADALLGEDDMQKIGLNR